MAIASAEAMKEKEDPTGEYPVLRLKAKPVHVDLGGKTHQGHVRERNEDQFLIAKLAKSMRICDSSLPESETVRFSDEEGYLMIVADGMGGVAGGQEASAMAVRTVESFVLEAIQWFIHQEDCEENSLADELRQALQRADRDIVTRAENESRLYGMGTTLTMAYSVGTDLFVVHAGDSRAYLYRGDKLERITSDHTLVQLLVDHGAITPEDARDHPRRHVITNVVGGPSEGVQVDIQRKQLEDGDFVLLCTDGLTEHLSDEEITRILGQSQGPEEAVRLLMDAVLATPAKDNITIVAAKYRFA
jgi:protein phosphatase